MQEFTDAELVAKYLHGEKEALEALVQRYFKQVFLFAKTFVKQDQTAEDITQEAFVKVWKNLKKFDPQKKFKTWLFQITKNTCIDYLRKHKQAVPPSSLDEEQMAQSLERLVDLSPLPQEAFDIQIFEQQLDKLLASLPENHKLVVVLHLQQDLTFQEISDLLKEPLNTIKSRYRRALLGLRKSRGQNPHAPKTQ